MTRGEPGDPGQVGRPEPHGTGSDDGILTDGRIVPGGADASGREDRNYAGFVGGAVSVAPGPGAREGAPRLATGRPL
jgi:hypothetical protein